MTLLQYFQMNATYHLSSHRGLHPFNRKGGERKKKIHEQRGRKMKEEEERRKLSCRFLKMLRRLCAPSSVNTTGSTGDDSHWGIDGELTAGPLTLAVQKITNQRWESVEGGTEGRSGRKQERKLSDKVDLKAEGGRRARLWKMDISQG